MESLEKAVWQDWLKRAEAGDTEAQWWLGYYFENGADWADGSPSLAPDLEQARYWNLLAAEQGHVNSQDSLVVLLSRKDSSSADIAEALRWAKIAIRQGSAVSAYNAAKIYRDLGKPTLAFRHYELALEMGDIESLLDIGLCQLFGLGTPQDIDSARKSMEKLLAGDTNRCSPRGRENTQYWLAIVRLLQVGGKKSAIAQARELLQKANADDDHEAANDLLNLIGRGPGRIHQ